MVENIKGKRELILEAAIKIYAQKGFQQSKIEDIAQEANVGKGTVYEYFGSKKELFEEMIKQSIEHYSSSVESQVRCASNSEESLKLAVKGHIEFCLEYRDMAQVFFHDHSWVDSEFTKWLMEMWEKKMVSIKAILEEGIEKGEFVPMDTKLVATAFLGMMEGICSPMILESEEVIPAHMAEDIVALMLSGIGTKKARH
ncbi:TetR/AcrR family fatty acid metabolism transcriptional regulator [Desulfitispora alkaliphila]|uniref:TetR/AcrR family transcriptional regulator n=1 Tax=Desulfitispora alkaliphila TaxID=622674 RepID=UPI003D2551A1